MSTWLVRRASASRDPNRRWRRLAGSSIAALFALTLLATPALAADPVAEDAFASISEGTATDVFLEFLATDDDFDALTFVIVDAPDHGLLTEDCTDGTCVYTPTSGYVGPDAFTWKANDGTADSNVATYSLTIVSPTVTTVPNTTTGAGTLGNAMIHDPATLTGASFLAVPPNGTPNGTSTALSVFPTHGATFGILTTGDASLADDPNDDGGSGADIGGGNVRGDTDYDVTVLKLDLTAPAGVNCLRIDLAFYSDEFPEFVGSAYNDGFIAELDTTTWSTSGSTISAPDNFAFDATGDVISINSSGATSMSAANAAGTTYDGATVLLRAATQVTPGVHSLYLSIFDQGDSVLNSAAFIDDIQFVTVGDPTQDCAEGAEVPTNTDPVAVDDTASTPFGTAVDIGVLANDSDPDGDTPLTVTLVTDPAHGTAVINANGTVTYTPDAGYSGPDTFDYTISDGHGGTDVGTVTVTVGAGGGNTPPTVDAGASKAGSEGSAISLDGTVTNAEAGDTVTQTWSYTLGAGTDAGMACSFGSAGSVDTTITCTDDGTVTVKLTASDGVNPPVEDTATLTITNADPTVSITSPADAASFQTAAAVNVSATIGDAGSNDTHTCSIDWGDGTTTTGTVGSGTCTGSHAYAAIGPKTITVTVTDDDTGAGVDTVGITITAPPANTPPTVDAGASKAGSEGSAISLDGTVTNAEAGDTVTQTWSYTLGAGTDAGMACSFGSAGSVDTTITCTDDGTVTVKLTASDGVNPPVEDTATLTITNADPTVSITSPADGSGANVGSSVSVTASRGDPGSNDTHTCSIDWGDGSVTTGSLTATTCTGSHTYAAIGVPTIRVTITDDDGGSAFDAIMLVVATPSSKVTGGGWYMVDGAKVRFGLVAQPAGSAAQGELQVRWGKHKFHGKTVTGLVVNKPTASWSGTGRYDGTAGYTYQVTVTDAGNGKAKAADSFAIVVRDPSGAVIYSSGGNLGGGNLKIH